MRSRRAAVVIVTVGATKGGVGKTTIALHLAIYRATAGRRVWLIDGDRQGSAQTALAGRAEAVQTTTGKLPLFACSQLCDGPALRSQIMIQRGAFDDIVIDAGGRDSSALRAALLVSDLLVVPFQPRSFDVWALQNTIELAKEAQSLRDGLQVVALMNNADVAGSDNADAARIVGEMEITLLSAKLTRRKAFAMAASVGFAVSEITPRDAKACVEISEVENLIYR